MSNLLASYRISENRIYVKTFYATRIVTLMRSMGGKFANGEWNLPLSRMEGITAQIGHISEPHVLVEVTHEDCIHTDGQVLIGFYVLASRSSRDSAATLYADLVAGTIPPYGGSTKYPEVNLSDDAKFQLVVPLDFAVANELKIIEDELNQSDRERALTQIKELMTAFQITVSELGEVPHA